MLPGGGEKHVLVRVCLVDRGFFFFFFFYFFIEGGERQVWQESKPSEPAILMLHECALKR